MRYFVSNGPKHVNRSTDYEWMDEFRKHYVMPVIRIITSVQKLLNIQIQ